MPGSRFGSADSGLKLYKRATANFSSFNFGWPIFCLSNKKDNKELVKPFEVGDFYLDSFNRRFHSFSVDNNV